MSDATAAHLWFWLDRSRPWINQVQILSTDLGSRVLTSIVAVCLGLVGRYVFKITRNILCYLVLRFGPQAGDDSTSLISHASPTNHTSTSGEANGTTRDEVETGRPNAKKVNFVLELLIEAEGSRDFASNIKSVWNNGTWREKILAIICILVFGGVFVGWASLCIVSSAAIASNGIGLSSSQHCGDWQYQDQKNPEYWNRESLYRRKREERASQYAENCYGRPSPADTLSCGSFYEQQIEFETRTQQPCPFNSPELCYEGPFSAITFDTGLVDASVLGINAAVTHKFRRRTACSPLNMSEPYIMDVSESPDKRSWRYDYGNITGRGYTDYTFHTSGRPFERQVSVYSANVHFSSLYPEFDPWKPRSELKQASDSTMTLVLVTSNHIIYEETNDDPIFPALTRYAFDDLQTDYFFNNDSRARPLVCIDTSLVCSPDGRQCWGMRDTAPNTITAHSSFYLMKFALENSNMREAMWFRLGAAFEATKKIGHPLSIPLAPNQWQIEAERLFAASLARIQYDTRRIAIGEDHDRHTYKDDTPEEVKGQLCNLYKFKTNAYINVSLVGFLGYICLAWAIFGLSRKLPSQKGESPIVPVAVCFAARWVYRKACSRKSTKVNPNTRPDSSPQLLPNNSPSP